MKSNKAIDHQLVNQFLEGDLSAIDKLILKYKNRVYTYILSIVKNQELAEDIFQETFIKVIKSLKSGKYEERNAFLSWVLRIAHNIIIDHFRKNKHMQTVSSEDSEVDVFNNTKLAEKAFEDVVITDQIKEDVRMILNLLPTEQKQVVLLRHFWGMSFKEIAEITGVSINTALGRMRYALINLRKIIKEKNLTIRV